MRAVALLSVAALSGLLAACGNGSDHKRYRQNPDLPDPHRGFLPTMEIAKPGEWGDQRPTVPEGYSITAIANDLRIPRQTLVLPNGDILVAEGRGGAAPRLNPNDMIAGIIKAQGQAR